MKIARKKQKKQDDLHPDVPAVYIWPICVQSVFSHIHIFSLNPQKTKLKISCPFTPKYINLLPKRKGILLRNHSTGIKSGKLALIQGSFQIALSPFMAQHVAQDHSLHLLRLSCLPLIWNNSLASVTYDMCCWSVDPLFPQRPLVWIGGLRAHPWLLCVGMSGGLRASDQASGSESSRW